MTTLARRRPLTRCLPLLAALVVAVLLPVTAQATSLRTVTARYVGSGLDSVAQVGPALYADTSGQGGEAQAVTLTPRAGETVLTVTLADRLGRPVLAAVVAHRGPGPDQDVELGRICAGAPGRFRLGAGTAPITIYLLAGRCPSGLSAPTSGTVTVGFGR